MIGRLLSWGVMLLLTLPILWLVCARIDVPLSAAAKACDRPMCAGTAVPVRRRMLRTFHR